METSHQIFKHDLIERNFRELWHMNKYQYELAITEEVSIVVHPELVWPVTIEVSQEDYEFNKTNFTKISTSVFNSYDLDYLINTLNLTTNKNS